MGNKIKGLHHITAIAGNAKANHNFYTKVLGLRLVKKTVNFDDPKTYHFYFGNESGEPGTILTFFPWEGIPSGRPGPGMATHIGYNVGKGSLPYWLERLTSNNVKHDGIRKYFVDEVLSFTDPDGLRISLVDAAEADSRKPFTSNGVDKANAITGFHHVGLTLRDTAPTASILTTIFDYKLLSKEENVTRYVTDAIDTAQYVDLIAAPDAARGLSGAGTNHHVAFRVADEETLMAFREKIEARGFSITPKIDRDYFFSLYFREPGGVLFEIATDNPGFATDEPLESLGTALRLPKQHEHLRSQIEATLPKI